MIQKIKAWINKPIYHPNKGFVGVGMTYALCKEYHKMKVNN